ncbi:hypothetical protein TWF718_006317 [Orbilia javanica]|uniref:Uncharacterized protein n=1 Tax=Orbilia javanica TaxID=47235 RepID=A0AAN8MT98_9PEZI
MVRSLAMFVCVYRSYRIPATGTPQKSVLFGLAIDVVNVVKGGYLITEQVVVWGCTFHLELAGESLGQPGIWAWGFLRIQSFGAANMKPFGHGARGDIVTSAMVDFTLKRIKECRLTSNNLASMSIM